MDKLDKLTDFHKKCIKNCVNYSKANSYKSKYTELSEDEVIARCRKSAGYSENTIFTLEDYCKAAKIDVDAVREFISDVKCDMATSNPGELLLMTTADWVIGYINTLRCSSIEDICEIANRSGYDISVPRFKGIQRKNKDMSKEEILAYCAMTPTTHNKSYTLNIDGKDYTLSKLCDIIELNYDQVRRNVIVNNELVIERLLVLTNKIYSNIFGILVFAPDVVVDNEGAEITIKKTLKQLCEDNNVNYNSAKTLKNRYNINSDELVVKYLAHPDKLTIKDRCDIEHVPVKKVYRYMERNPKVTIEQAIEAVKKAYNMEDKE